MRSDWFFTELPPSRSVIENTLRLAFWKAGYGDFWFSCTRDESPYECQGIWHKQPFRLEWKPGEFVMLKMPEPNDALLKALERVLKHRALAAYRNGDGNVTVEWRNKNGAARLQELEASGAKDLQKL
jgi:hypothetical protein